MMEGSHAVPIYERNLSSLIDFENFETPGVALGEQRADNNVPIANANQPLETCNASRLGGSSEAQISDAARIATLQKRNLMLQKALALASKQHAKEVTALRREIENLKEKLAKMEEEGNGGGTLLP